MSEQVPREPATGRAGDTPTVQSVVGAVTIAGPAGEVVGGTIGPYRLLAQIGEGGFGSVYLAEQTEPVRRRVALKVIKLGMDTRQVVARFEQERQALALMDHPNIAKVLDAGATAAGRPFFVMELVKGDPITAYCERAGLGIPERLELVAQVCSAVQHAHAKGIIHRDLKPSNILVSAHEGGHVPKIIDFGIAKATISRLTDKTLFTEHRALVGTPEYMSPEQARGDLDIDTRADVYSLGAVLYELLTGETPFDPETLRAASYDQIQRIIREVEPPKPSTRIQKASGRAIAPASASRRPSTALRGELDWIVMKAMEKDRQRRYETAIALAQDIRRYLSGEAVLAAPPSTAYRVRKFVGRHRGLVASAALVAVALLLGIVGTGLALLDANRQRARAEVASGRESEARQVAEERLAEAEATVEFLDTMLAAADPLAQGRDVTVRQVLDQAVGAVDERFAGRPLVAARLHGTIGRTYLNLGAIAEAERPLRRQLDLQASTLGGDDRGARRALNDLAQFLQQSGQYAEAERTLTEAIARNEALFGRGDPITVESLEVLGGLLTEVGRVEDAEPVLVEVIDELTRTVGAGAVKTQRVRNALALLYADTGREEEAEGILRDLVRALGASHGADNFVSLDVRSNLAWLLYYRAEHEDAPEELTGRRLEEARSLGEAVIEDATRSLGAGHRITLNAMNNLSLAYKALGMADRALELQLRVLEASEVALGENHPDLIISLGNVGNMLRQLGRFEEALPYQVRAVRMARELLAPDAFGLIINLAWYGASLRALNRFAEAEAITLECHAKALQALGPDHMITRDQARVLVQMYEAWEAAEPGQGHGAKAEAWRARAPEANPSPP